MVVGLPGRLFIQCPRNSALPTTFDGDGTVLQDVWNTTTGNAHSLIYIGAVPLPKSDPGQPFAERFARFVPSFVAGMTEKYARVDFALVTEPRGIKVEKVQVKLNAKPATAWRTSKYVTRPSAFANKTGAILTGEAAFLGDEASDTLIYLIVDSKSRRITLDKILEAVSIQKTRVVNSNGRWIHLNDIVNALDGRYPMRFASYASPSGFAPTLATVRLTDDLVYAEDRLDERGTVTGSCRIEHRNRGDTPSLEGEAELERSSRKLKDAGAARSIDLASPGSRALLFSYRTRVGDRPCAASSAVFAMDDKIWIFTWTTFGDEALEKADVLAFETLLRGLHVAIR